MALGASTTALLVVSGCCSTVDVPVLVQRPAVYPLTHYKRLAVDSIGGVQGQVARDLIQAALFQKGFEVLDRDQIAVIEREGGADAKAGAVIRGSVTQYRATRSGPREAGTQVDGRGRAYPFYEETFEGQVALSMRVTDASTKLVAPPTTYSKSRQQTTESPSPGARPPEADTDALLQMALQDAVREFLEDVTPYSERRTLKFYISGELPELEASGIAAIQANDWQRGIEVFRAATTRPVSEPLESGKAYYNLGLALMYTGEFVDARAALERAGELGVAEAAERLGELPGMQAEHERLSRQQGRGAA